MFLSTTRRVGSSKGAVRSVFALWFKAFGKLTVGLALVASGGMLSAMHAPAAEQPPVRPSRVERLMRKHDCWVDAAPAGVAVSRSVVTLPGERAMVRSARVGFGIWLEGDPGVVHAFCA